VHSTITRNLTQETILGRQSTTVWLISVPQKFCCTLLLEYPMLEFPFKVVEMIQNSENWTNLQRSRFEQHTSHVSNLTGVPPLGTQKANKNVCVCVCVKAPCKVYGIRDI
jgi:hypothetical protein